EARNAINDKLRMEIRAALENFEKDGELRSAVLTHSGPVFCAGKDLKEWLENTPETPSEAEDWGFAGMVEHILSKPLIAAVNGKALGGGTEIALAADMVVASPSSIFGLPETSLGIVPGGGGLITALRQMPMKAALEMIFTGAPINAQRACELGLVNHVVPEDKVLETALQLAEKINANAPIAVRCCKAIAYRAMDSTAFFPPAAWKICKEYEAINSASEDHREGLRSFTEKRKPVWKNK
ncbi:MAG: enoyl-CoA hydratase/isomerase family protein, partial [Deltaproteobacteria bacterium]|nr:enoyl-CoA hydratase/isomerase family protein [Deltaproteobacteria bacterium]